MNKIYSKLMAVILVLVTAFSLTACGEVELGSKIDRAEITVELTNEDGEVEEYTLNVKFYVNFAPETIKHIENKINAGYYNGLDVTNVTSSYFTFGDYRLADGKLEALDQGKAIEGEFEKKGWKGNKLSISQGSLILVHDAESEGAESKYDTGKATIAVAFSSAAPFASDEYCVFGKFDDKDGNKDADSTSMEAKSSKEKVMTISEKAAKKDGRKLYFCVNDDTEANEAEDKYNWENKYITYAEYEETFHYFLGDVSAADITAGKHTPLTESEEKDIEKKLDNSRDFRCIPALKVVIKNIKMAK